MNLVKLLQEEILGFAELLFPAVCPLCRNRPLHSHRPGLCDECQTELEPVYSPCCTTCSLPFEGPPGSDHRCEICLRDHPPFSKVMAFGIYKGLLREAVHRFKYEEAFYLHRPLGRLLAGVVSEKQGKDFSDLLIPVPLHINKLRERTYNQALLLAKTLGKTLKLPVEAQGLERTRTTSPQQGLKSVERKRNLQGAFALRKEVKDLRILLVDDVLTTGATARECSRILIKGGAKEVQVAILARAAKHI